MEYTFLKVHKSEQKSETFFKTWKIFCKSWHPWASTKSRQIMKQEWALRKIGTIYPALNGLMVVFGSSLLHIMSFECYFAQKYSKLIIEWGHSSMFRVGCLVAIKMKHLSTGLSLTSGHPRGIAFIAWHCETSPTTHWRDFEVIHCAAASRLFGESLWTGETPCKGKDVPSFLKIR